MPNPVRATTRYGSVKGAAPSTALEDDGPRQISLVVGDGDAGEFSGVGSAGLELTKFALRSGDWAGTDRPDANGGGAGGN